MNKHKIVAIVAAGLILAVASASAALASIGTGPDTETAALSDTHLERIAQTQQIQAHENWVAGTAANISGTVQAEIDHSDSVVQEKEAARQAATTKSSRSAARSGSSGGGHLDKIASCESGGNPSAVSSSGKYRGKYQFDQQTWNSVGGSGDPAGASEAEQDARASQLYAQRGSSPWANCA